MTNGTNAIDVTALGVVGIFISPGHNFFGHHEQPVGTHPTISVNEIVCVAGKGLSGDRFFSFKENYKGQVTFFSSEVFEDVCRRLGVSGKSPGVTRRNVVTRGVDLNSLVERGGSTAARARRFACGHSDRWYAARGRMNFSVVILAGGKSSRMGQGKAWLQINGESLLARQIRLVREVGADEVYISGRANMDYSRFDCRVLYDRLVDAGPFGGIEGARACSSCCCWSSRWICRRCAQHCRATWHRDVVKALERSRE